MGMQVQERDRVVVVSVQADQCGQLWRTIEPHLDAGKRSFVLDLAGIAFLNSVNIAAIIAAKKKVVGGGGKIALANLGEHVKAVFRVLKLERLFDLELDVAKAAAVAR